MSNSKKWCLNKFCEHCTEPIKITTETMFKDRLPACPLPYSSETVETIRFYAYCPECGVCIEVDSTEIPESVQKEVPFASK